MSISIGDSVPSVKVFSTDPMPEHLVLSELLMGKTSVLLFFPAAHTRVCEAELCSVRDNLEQYNSLGAQVFGMSVDTPFTLAAWAKQLGLEYRLLSDYSKEAIKAFGVESMLKGLPGFSQRSAFVFDQDGILRWKWVAEVNSQEPPYAQIVQAISQI